MAIRYDSAGNQISLPPRCTLSYEEFADCVDKLTPDCCSFPSGKRIDPRTKRPCRRHKICDDGCELHATRKASRRLRAGRGLPKSVRLKFANAFVDGELLSIQHDVALVDARLMILKQRLGTGESGDAWMRLNELWTDLVSLQQQAKQAREMGDNELAAKMGNQSLEVMQAIGKVIKSGNEDERTWREIQEVQDRLTTYKAMETRRKRESGQTLDAEQALMLVQKMIDAVNDTVKDDAQRHELAITLGRLVGIAGIVSSRVDSQQRIDAKRPAGLSVTDYLEG